MTIAIVTDSCCDLRPVLVDRKRGEFSVAHFEEPENSEWLRDRLEKLYDVTDMHLVETGPVIATHCGTGWGVTVLPTE